eukprot:scaffold22177_cov31-Tisochrysis_lutea.AAC.3
MPHVCGLDKAHQLEHASSCELERTCRYCNRIASWSPSPAGALPPSHPASEGLRQPLLGQALPSPPECAPAG